MRIYSILLILIILIGQSCSPQYDYIDENQVEYNPRQIVIILNEDKDEYLIEKYLSRASENVLIEKTSFYLSKDTKDKFNFYHSKQKFKIIETSKGISEQVFPHHKEYTTHHLKNIGDFKVVKDFNTFYYDNLSKQEQNVFIRDHDILIAMFSRKRNTFKVYEVDLVEVSEIQ